MCKNYNPWEEAENLGITLKEENPEKYTKLFNTTHHNLNGLTLINQNLIVLNPHQTPEQKRCTLTHELIHYTNKHTHTPNKQQYKHQEKQANHTAAQKLINHHELLQEIQTTPDEGRWCTELNITPQYLHHYLQTLTQKQKQEIKKYYEISSGFYEHETSINF